MLIAGVDEAGRGPLAGPVVAAAVILNSSLPINGLKDSKLLSSNQRSSLFKVINENALAVSWSYCTVEEIDKYNILQASLLAMKRAVLSLKITPDQVLVDGKFVPDFSKEQFKAKAIVDGDKLELAISAASIVAKVIRDQLMLSLDVKYPNYGFAKHKGYGTKEHILALQKYGPIVEHRKLFLRKIIIPVK